MKTHLSTFTIGIALELICKLITNNDYFIFGMLTFIIIPILFLTYFLVTRILNWWFTLLCFLICFVLTYLLMEGIVSAFPDVNYTNAQSFPLSNYYIVNSILIVISKILLDMLIRHFLPTKFIRESMAENVFQKLKKAD